nr:unnamed protein product [Brassica rapa]
MLMIDAEGTVAQGFIGQNRRTQYEKELRLGTEWYYIACKDCQTKLNRGPTTMLCPKCGNENATAVAKILPPLKTPPHSEVKIPDLPESSGGVSSASDEQKKAKRAKLSG